MCYVGSTPTATRVGFGLKGVETVNFYEVAGGFWCLSVYWTGVLKINCRFYDFEVQFWCGI
jgi:hypothetical protein